MELADPHQEADVLGDPDPLFGTETMAELCVRQGRVRDAVSIYRRLLAVTPADDQPRRERWEGRLAALADPARRGQLEGHTLTDSRKAGQALPRLVRPPPPPAPPPRSAHRLPLVIREPIRSGQIVYAEKNDLIVLGPVNPGAQLIADGNIHVYSRLRGRAVAGAHGARQARIYCQRLDAELVGIDSVYLTADDIPPERLGLPAQIFVDSGRCVIAPL